MQNNKPLALRQPTESELEEILGFFKDGYAPHGFIYDLTEMFHSYLDYAMNNGERVNLEIVNALFALKSVAKILHAINPYNTQD